MSAHSPRLTGPVWMVALPLAIVGVTALLLAVPATREGAMWSLAEMRPVELLTFVLLMVGGVWGVRLAWALRRRAPAAVSGFYLLFGLGLLVIGAEEVAWGQWFLHFETPEALAAVNTQGELTLHNHEAFNDHLEVFPMLFGLAGLLGIWLGRFRAWAPVAVAPALWVWFGLIAGLSAVDLLQDFYILHPALDGLLNYMDEAVEMMVGAAGLLYVAINAQRLPAGDTGPVPSTRSRLDGLRQPASPRRKASARSTVSRLPM